MSAENLDITQLNTSENLLNSCISLVSINHQVNHYSAGIINTNYYPREVSEIPIYYVTRPSDPVINFTITEFFESFEKCDAEMAIFMILNQASRFAGKHASLVYPRDLVVPHVMPLLVKKWDGLRQSDIKSILNNLYTFG